MHTNFLIYQFARNIIRSELCNIILHAEIEYKRNTKTIFFLKQKTSGAINYLSKRESLTQGKFIYLSTVYLSVKCNFKTYGFYIKTYFDQTFIKQFH